MQFSMRRFFWAIAICAICGWLLIRIFKAGGLLAYGIYLSVVIVVLALPVLMVVVGIALLVRREDKQIRYPKEPNDGEY